MIKKTQRETETQRQRQTDRNPLATSRSLKKGPVGRTITTGIEDRQTDRQTDRHTGRQKHRETERSEITWNFLNCTTICSRQKAQV